MKGMCHSLLLSFPNYCPPFRHCQSLIKSPCHCQSLSRCHAEPSVQGWFPHNWLACQSAKRPMPPAAAWLWPCLSFLDYVIITQSRLFKVDPFIPGFKNGMQGACPSMFLCHTLELCHSLLLCHSSLLCPAEPSVQGRVLHHWFQEQHEGRGVLHWSSVPHGALLLCSGHPDASHTGSYAVGHRGTEQPAGKVRCHSYSHSVGYNCYCYNTAATAWNRCCYSSLCLRVQSLAWDVF
jgi:hypothetical protein